MIVAMEHLCLAACLAESAEHITQRAVDQVLIANQLGVSVPSEAEASELRYRGVNNVRIDTDPRMWGIAPTEQEIEQALERSGIALKCVYRSISLFKDWEFEEELANLASSMRFPIVGFEYNALFGEFVRGEQGHCAVVFGCAGREGNVRVDIYDPGPRCPGFRTVDGYDLYRACRKKPGGIWVLHCSADG